MDYETVVKEIVKDGEQSVEARAELNHRRAELLEAVIARVKPALRYVGTRPETSYSVSHYEDVNYHGGNSEKEHYPHRCVRLSGDGAEEDNPRANEGQFDGCDLLLNQNGSLLMFQYDGNWSRWQGSTWGWKAQIYEYQTVKEAVEDGWHNVETYIENLNDVLAQAVGKRKGSIESDRRRAEKMAAIKTLLTK